MKQLQMVHDFHEKYAIRWRNWGDIMTRFRLINEELAEVQGEMWSKYRPEFMAKELADLLYVVLGLIEFYYGDRPEAFAEIFEAVHQSNMSKTGSKDLGGKSSKGEGYVDPLPEIRRIIADDKTN